MSNNTDLDYRNFIADGRVRIFPYIDSSFSRDILKGIRIEQVIDKFFTNCHIHERGDVRQLAMVCPYREAGELEGDEWKFNLADESFEARCPNHLFTPNGSHYERGNLVDMAVVWLYHYKTRDRQRTFYVHDAVFEIADRLGINPPGPLGGLKCPKCGIARLVPLKARHKWEANFICSMCHLIGRYDGESE